ncbi:amino acid ABC transporter ATP-binding protein [Brenneria goodwinii]|uniref:Amino acid ABC transporter ATP-binding protein n=1 Tax=Brenneria goodwinii TaxID=1109412 RepID=A0AAE8EQ86_9GAMM|nr:amino acid ABC transporter ATP-binding protein [Brenneria goodwinii]ATA23298.1 amino acid ABC transporter ATP-binding protein [Brenneria goodwinii]RLM22046.1 amino acid ABC transporter ATP-binding protein [Brenneria goodwinii]
MIRLENIHKRFDDEEVLKGASIDIKKGQVVCLIGPSGSGKTTLLRCINFLEKADKGRITIGSVSVDCEKASKKDIENIRAKTAMVFQSYNLFNNKTALENVMEGLIYAKGIAKKEAKEIAENLLRKVGLAHKQDTYPSKLSGGQKQRVGIARALAMNPDVLLLDEPTSALDPEIVGEILKLIREIAQEGQTMIIVTHEMSFANEVASNVIFMEKGLIVEENIPREIFSNPKESRTKEFLERINFTI